MFTSFISCLNMQIKYKVSYSSDRMRTLDKVLFLSLSQHENKHFFMFKFKSGENFQNMKNKTVTSLSGPLSSTRVLNPRSGSAAKTPATGSMWRRC